LGMLLNHDRKTDKSTAFSSNLTAFGASERQSRGGDKNITKCFVVEPRQRATRHSISGAAEAARYNEASWK
jgi:hypothetical protein